MNGQTHATLADEFNVYHWQYHDKCGTAVHSARPYSELNWFYVMHRGDKIKKFGKILANNYSDVTLP